MRSGGGQLSTEVIVRRRLAVRADLDQVWAVASTTLHLPDWTLLGQRVPGTSPERLFLVRPRSNRRCSVVLLERRQTETGRQDWVDLTSGRVPYRIEVERTRSGCRLAIEVHAVAQKTSTKDLSGYWHRWADAWLHSVDLLARGQLAPFTPDLSVLDDYGPLPSTALVSSSASRLFPHTPQHIWDRMTSLVGPPRGPLLHRVRLTPGTLTVGTRSLQANASDDQIFAFLLEVTQVQPDGLLTQRRLDGSLSSTLSWQLAEQPGGTLVTLEHTSDRAAQQDLARGLDQFGQMIGTE